GTRRAREFTTASSPLSETRTNDASIFREVLAIAEAKFHLSRLGFHAVSNETQADDSAFDAEIASFQASVGLTPDGSLTPAVLEKMRREIPPARRGRH